MSFISPNDHQLLTVSNIKTSDLETSKLIFSKCCVFKLDSFTLGLRHYYLPPQNHRTINSRDIISKFIMFMRFALCCDSLCYFLLTGYKKYLWVNKQRPAYIKSII